MTDQEIYYHTNEDLSEALTVIQPLMFDRVLAVCGSGDHAFAMTEKTSKVVAVEKDADQFAYAVGRRNALVNGNYELFRGRQPYFTNERCEAIRSRINNLSLVHGNVFDTDGEFNKVYLSNALDWSYRESAMDGITSDLVKLSSVVSNNGLVFLVKGFQDRKLSGLIPREFVVDPFALQILGNDYESKTKAWEPVVLRRVRRDVLENEEFVRKNLGRVRSEASK